MAKPRQIVKRRKAVRNIRKITRTMQLIATARFSSALSRATASKPYTEKLAELAADLSKAAGSVEHPLMKTHEDVKKTALVVITSQRGLCGSYNSNVLRESVAHLDRTASSGQTTDVHAVGKKGINYFRFLRRPIVRGLTHISDAPKYEQVEPIATELMNQFTSGQVSAVHVAYMRFVSIAQQRPTILQLLPMRAEEAAGGAAEEPAAGPQVEYEFSPSPAELLDELLPATVRIRLFQCFLEAAVSEQISRMVAMKAATDAAGDMIKLLTRQYNRARQTQITLELLDIVGGANALAE